MRKNYDADADVLCPFYHSDDRGMRMICEGIYEGGTITHRFPNYEAMKQQKRIFCCCAFQKCEWHKTLMQSKYEE